MNIVKPPLGTGLMKETTLHAEEGRKPKSCSMLHLSMASQHAEWTSRCRGSAKPQLCLHLPKRAITATEAPLGETWDTLAPITDLSGGNDVTGVTGDQAANLLIWFLLAVIKAAQRRLRVFLQLAAFPSLCRQSHLLLTPAMPFWALERGWRGLWRKRGRFDSRGSTGLIQQTVGSIRCLLTASEAHFSQNL